MIDLSEPAEYIYLVDCSLIFSFMFNWTRKIAENLLLIKVSEKYIYNHSWEKKYSIFYYYLFYTYPNFQDDYNKYQWLNKV